VTPQFHKIRHRVVHMVCLRAPHGVLPATSFAALPLGLLIAALPSGLMGPWPNTADVLDLVRGIVLPRRSQPSLTYGCRRVGVGMAVEDRPGFAWTTCQE
jgi:hypothetical protein